MTYEELVTSVAPRYMKSAEPGTRLEVATAPDSPIVLRFHFGEEIEECRLGPSQFRALQEAFPDLFSR